MGIKQLSKLLKENCAKGIKERPLAYYSSKRIAIDASMSMYQFLIAVRSDGSSLGNEDSPTSHLVGFFYRTIRMVELGIIPVYVFDGVPPEVKMKELEKRSERRAAADKEYKEASEMGDKKLMEMYDKRKTKVTGMHVEECKRLLGLMGIPFETAPSEAEAYCAFLCKKKAVYGVATEDMDALTFGSPVVLRNFSGSQSRKLPIVEYNLPELLESLSLEHEEFIDLCILLGCDYCGTLKGIGPKRALGLIKKHGGIEKILQSENLEVPDGWRYRDAQRIFGSLPEIGDAREFNISWGSIDRNGIVSFLVEEKGFDLERVNRGIEKLVNSRKKGVQGRLDGFIARSR
ncbi:flap endonuclease-1 [Encephalitozoon intestinalis ATCC 50506]|uniref:Flap endonuclease 1 n=1 Tax=Encephalitozoon intestinalis (strain ATCC 50506) TaxID=876142 RepID=E0S6A6_ENCIT|nr:flap endonuclease-1 [Encephalitozoon intestinalis ATCC 50506]ADM11241.1 flap endonuclease-1 [Encephalitozoon intestinalis ATCC 50506]UTX44909.1 flap endonuclease-1 [Encephalitozoon intestinalis]